jgi:hypothetical protein
MKRREFITLLGGAAARGACAAALNACAASLSAFLKGVRTA